MDLWGVQGEYDQNAWHEFSKNVVIKMMRMDDNWRGLRSAWIAQVIKQRYGGRVREFERQTIQGSKDE